MMQPIINFADPKIHAVAETQSGLDKYLSDKSAYVDILDGKVIFFQENAKTRYSGVVFLVSLNKYAFAIP